VGRTSLSRIAAVLVKSLLRQLEVAVGYGQGGWILGD